ncbi:type II secretion system minor pseudopilin GspH [Halomonas sp. McH1-25]|uniref:type II secretion system minor pseudopilin GspH n=1 Tax=unclassified Halomonas TaxID=2609666 RepID=UPI001EF5BCD7|nr:MULTISPECIES: type II secretion system minor pseudopilin GspH [unclassified Halomonas]MCG7601616.1 type II secretion system minor pseudopilin GspH [Halomonas sp. McH1-25]MCP1342263.1 type II secretion system minor pseudopilin GspH [Halomonas sp. FL8]MCP1363339.1 type II secretion system minor pseudopilin GspH [Halomonas sp. BBD45]MCP1366735.1 type II secretion system minor pseudopilin GspH [Halomonas sp. BBD48]
MNCSHARGFTLLELLVVVVIVSLATTLSVAWLGGDDHRRLDAAAERLHSDLNLARDMAFLDQRIIGWQADAQGYRFVTWRYVPDSGVWRWVPLESQRLTPQPWPMPLAVESVTAKASSADDTDMPRLVWWPNGEVIGGRLVLDHDGARRALEVDALGVYRVKATDL